MKKTVYSVSQGHSEAAPLPSAYPTPASVSMGGDLQGAVSQFVPVFLMSQPWKFGTEPGHAIERCNVTITYPLVAHARTPKLHIQSPTANSRSAFHV